MTARVAALDLAERLPGVADGLDGLPVGDVGHLLVVLLPQLRELLEHLGQRLRSHLRRFDSNADFSSPVSVRSHLSRRFSKRSLNSRACLFIISCSRTARRCKTADSSDRASWRRLVVARRHPSEKMPLSM